MKNKRILIVLLMIIVLSIALSIKTYAADSFSAALTPSTQSVAKGEEFTVTLKLTGINVQDGISAVEGTLKYDTDVLKIKDPATDVKAATGWTIEYNEENSKFIIDRTDSVNQDTEIATIKFAVDENTSAQMATVTIASMAGGNSSLSEKIEISDITTNISISSGITIPTTSATVEPSTTVTTSPVETVTPSTETTIEPSTAVPTQETTTSQPTTTVKEEDIPSTGAENFVIPLIVIICILGTVSFIGYKKMDK